MASAALAHECPPLTGWKLWAAAVSLALANFVVVLDTTIANVSVPHIAGGLAISPMQGTWAITSYAVADAISVPLTGWLAARFGSVRWYLMSMVGFGIFSLLCGLSRSIDALIIFRVLQGLSGGPLMPLSQTLLLRVFPKNKAAVGLSIWAMTTTSAPIIGPILGGLISDNWSWPWIFFINLPVVGICIFSVRNLVLRFDTKPVKKKIDLGGLVLLVVAVGAFQIMLDTGRENDWFSSGWVLGLAIVAAIAFALFIAWELTEAEPIVDIRVFRNRGFAAGTVAISLAYGAFFASVVLTPLWLQQVVGYTATQSGFTVAWIGVFAVALAPVAARLIGRVDLRITVCAGIVWMGFVSMLRTGWTADVNYWTLATPQLLQGMGMPFFFIGLTALALSSVPTKDQISAAGLMSFTRTLSGAIATALASSAWDTSTRVARSDVVASLNNPAGVMAKLQDAGMTLEQSRSVVERLVDTQASTLGVLHIYVVAAISFGLAAIAVWFAPKPKAGAEMPNSH